MVNRKYDGWEKEQLQDAISKSVSISGALRLLGKDPRGGNFRHFHSLVEKHNIDTSHFTGQSQFGPRPRMQKSLDDWLVQNNSGQLKNHTKQRIIKAGLLDYKCAGCGITSWSSSISESNDITLQIDHINGDPKDHRIENLRMLCPNCHSQTETYCGKKNRKNSEESKQKLCACGTKIQATSKGCIKCTPRKKKIVWPPVETILQMLKTSLYTDVAKELGISQTAIKKHLRSKGIEPPKSIYKPSPPHQENIKIAWPPVETILKMLETDYYTVVGAKIGATDRSIRSHLEKNGIKPPTPIRSNKTL